MGHYAVRQRYFVHFYLFQTLYRLADIDVRKDALALRIVAAEQVVEQQLGRTVALHMCVLVDQEVDHAAADVLDICWDKVVADEADAACRTHFGQRLTRADLAVYRDVHTAEVGMLAQRPHTMSWASF